MDDNRKKPPRNGGSRSGGPRGGVGSAKGGRTFGDGGKKPFVKRGDKAGEARGDRPKRVFSGDERPRAAERSAKPHGSDPRPSRKPFEGRGEADGQKRYRERTASDETAERSHKPRGDGERHERKPFEERGNQRPGRRERAERGSAGEMPAKRAEKPFRAGPRPAGKTFGKQPFGDKSRSSSPARSGVGRSGAGEGPRRRTTGETEPGERIAKRLARAGIASRRDAEDLIAAGRVKVNGKVLSSPAFNVLPDDRIELDGTVIPPIERTRLFLFHKPAGLVTTNRDPEGRRTVFDVLPADLPRLMTVGRLDINTEGLLLLTNDGGLARVLELPATGWLRRYRARVHGKVEEKALAGLKEGIAVDGVFYGAVEASLDREQGSNAWLTIGLREGKNREVKNILGALGLDVTRLIRISYGPFQLGELPEGAVQELKGRMLRDQLGERLIEESGANFDAPIAKPFSNKPVLAERNRQEDRAERPRERENVQGAIGKGGLIKGRKRREDSRDAALSRLSTRPEGKAFGERGGKGGPRIERGGKKPGEREQRPIDPPGGRRANVWMAPGARPIGKKSETSASPSSRFRGEGKGEGQRAGIKKKARSTGDSTAQRGESLSSAPRPPRERGEGKGAKNSDRPRGGGPKGPRRGRSDADRRR